jgi:predicted DCC family thiol-disulfide oxidoreductase YuxK
MMLSAGSSAPAHRAVVLFDGTCGLCERSVRFMARRDAAGHFQWAASQSPAGADLLARHGLTGEAGRTMILIENGRVYRRSTASLLVASRLRWPWSLLRVFLIVPVPVRDAVYDAIAAVRHRLMRRPDVCELPPPDLRAPRR